MILGKDYLQKAEEAGTVRIYDRQEFSAFSLNIRLSRLFRHDTERLRKYGFREMRQEPFIEQILEEIKLTDKGHELRHNRLYYWLPHEEMYLGKGILGEITSRSSWARLGVAVRDKSDDYLHDPDRDCVFRPLLMLHTTGSRVLVHKGDAIGQLFVNDLNSDYEYVSSDLENRLIESGEFLIKKNDKVLKAEDIQRHGNIILHLDPEILVYTGRRLIPGKLQKKDFKKIRLTKPTKLRKGTFFLSASEEYVEIPKGFVGYVTEASTFATLQRFVEGDGDCMPLPFMSHPNAPYIGPKNVFKGRITFENCMKYTGYIIPGMKQSELILKKFLTDDGVDMPSRYMDQKNVTASRL